MLPSITFKIQVTVISCTTRHSNSYLIGWLRKQVKLIPLIVTMLHHQWMKTIHHFFEDQRHYQCHRQALRRIIHRNLLKEEDRNYTYITSGTPCRGRLRFPKVKTIGWHNDQDRLMNCKGDIYMLNQTNSFRCYLCKSKTKFFYVCCKQPYCLGGNDTKIMNLICNNAEEGSMLNGVRPAATHRINQVAEDNNSTMNLCTVINSCYHIQHKAARQALSRIQENINNE